MMSYLKTVNRSIIRLGHLLKNKRRCCSTLLNISNITECERSFNAPSIRELENRLHHLHATLKKGSRNCGIIPQPHIAGDHGVPLVETKSMRSSYQEACIELGSKPYLSDTYISYRPIQQDNTIRIGRLLEDLDTFAAWVCSQHNTRNGQKDSPLVFVTKTVDRIVLDNTQISPARDIKMTGCMTWTGKTSMQVSMNLLQDEDGELVNKLNAVFVMVARDPNNTVSVPVNPIEAETPEEKFIFRKAQAGIEKKKQQDEKSLLKIAPTPQESQMVHTMFTDTLSKETLSFSNRVKPDNMVWMEDAELKNVFICFPDQSNIYNINKIFGGYLMRKAIELAYTTALVYSKSPVIFRCIDNIKFKLPVEVGSLLNMRSQVTYTKHNFMQVRVHAEVINPETGEKRGTNLFNFTLAAKSDVKRVVPKVYGESMLYLDGRRHFKEFEQRELTHLNGKQ